MKAYKEEQEADITLLTGLVEVDVKGRKVSLNPREQLKITGNSIDIAAGYGWMK